MEIVAVDEKGRIVIPSRMRRKLHLKDGDRLLVLAVKDDILILKKIDVEKVLRDLAEEIAKAGLNLEELTEEVKMEANKIAKEKIPPRH